MGECNHPAIWVDPGRMGGKPCIYGHRLSTAAIARLHRDGADVTGLYPEITEEQVAAAVAFEDWLVARAAAPDALRGDGPCHDCGGPNVVWFAPNELWNMVMGGPDATGDPGGLLCPQCFIRRAEAAGVRPAAWRLLPEERR